MGSRARRDRYRRPDNRAERRHAPGCTAGTVASSANGQYVSGEYFSGLGVSPAAGRLIGAADDSAGAPPVVVLSFGYAQRRFGDVSTSLGQSILINNTPFTVAGVSAPEFFGVNPAGPQDVYLPMRAHLSNEPVATGNPNRYWSK